MRSKRFGTVMGAATLLLAATTAFGQVQMYGGVARGDGTTPGGLLLVSQTDASSVLVGDPVTPGGITGLDFSLGGVLYASSIDGPGGNRTSTLVTLDPSSGTLLTTVGPITAGPGGPAISIGDLSFQPGTGVLYGTKSNADATAIPGGTLYTIDTSTAVATAVGGTGTGEGGGLAFAPDGTLYGTASGPSELLTIDPTNALVLGSVAVTRYYDGLAVDPVTGVIWANGAGAGSGGGDVFTLTPSGAETLVGNTGFATSDLAFVDLNLAAIPTVSTWGLIVLALLLLSAGTIVLRRRSVGSLQFERG